MVSDAVTGISSREARQQKLVFVTGASRSGTTMLSRILGKADRCLALNELHFFGDLVPLTGDSTDLQREQAYSVVAMTLARHHRDFWVKNPTQEERADARRLVDALDDEELNAETLFAVTMSEIRRNAGVDLLCEQTPRNIFYARFLLRVFPNAQIVHVVRDPRAVLASQKNRYRMRKLGGRNVPTREIVRLWLNYHPITMTRLWLSATREAIAMSDVERFRIVRYEDLIDRPESTVRGLCANLEIGFQPLMLDVPHWGSSTVSHSSGGGISSASLEKWRTVLNSTEIAYCDSRTKAERDAFGYDQSQVRTSPGGILRFLLRLPIHVVGVLISNPRRMMVQLKAMLTAGS